ncbi:NTE family protein RssA [Candidatus Filomicrobium marinum]|uniref:NTE family protein RssA n=2 Tax=Filomicrobium TaxID=119044 RepID=A0A0D6JIW1_9HYPH|nr:MULTISPECIES: patatin-like phospholipase family protein [Filomicrobium]MCV0369254.1 patatin-like phospholipase family protein [Filomicrobium sp.]CFX38410.1 NTE family protein RssA [Candidatus Filomicrobium marinum]CPR21518.1 NTE family protein RssA [Candidatus Filomicrobium marinum]SDP29640.1 NTE family protein [Filomicrobium insigne]
MEYGKIGLALGGGAARGWSHIGVIRALSAAGIEPDIIAGTSIGAVVGGCYAAGHLDDLEDMARGLTVRGVWNFLDFNLAGTGLISGTRLNSRLKKVFGDVRIEDLDCKFTAVATEIGTGHEIWLSRGELGDAVRASYALPGVLKPVKLNGRWLFDGALVNPVPVSVCRALGARYVIAVNLNFDLSSRGTTAAQFDLSEVVEDEEAEPLADIAPRSFSNGFGARRLLQRQIFGKGDKSVPGISTVMVDAFNIVQDRIARSRLAGDPPDAMISPRLYGFNLFDFHRASELIDLGRLAAERELETIRQEISVRRQLGRLKAGVA